MSFHNNDNLFNDIITIHDEQIDEYKKQISILNTLISYINKKHSK